MLGQERTVVPLLASEVFEVTGVCIVLSFVAAFGLTKALSNLARETLASRRG